MLFGHRYTIVMIYYALFHVVCTQVHHSDDLLCLFSGADDAVSTLHLLQVRGRAWLQINLRRPLLPARIDHHSGCVWRTHLWVCWRTHITGWCWCCYFHETVLLCITVQPQMKDHCFWHLPFISPYQWPTDPFVKRPQFLTPSFHISTMNDPLTPSVFDTFPLCFQNNDPLC